MSKIEQLAEGVTLHLGDCREILPTLGKVDAVVTDPPYELSAAGPGRSHFGMSLNKFDSQDYKSIVSGFDHVEIFSALEKICDPTVKPLPLMAKYIRICSKHGQTILDPFMGSGTTGIAAAKLGRNFVGIEREPKYFDIACRRIQAALDAPDMFVEPPKPAKQEAML